MEKMQISNTRLQKNFKLQTHNSACLELGNWSFSGAWNLRWELSPPPPNPYPANNTKSARS
jgi:hypothetical protein